MQNRLARVVLLFSAGATEARCELHWLPIRQRITFKLATITYKARWSGQLAYLSNSLYKYLPTRNLWSASALLLQQPPATTVFSSRAFPVAAPSVWNSLNIHTRSAETFLTFKSRLKTELFTASYDTWLSSVITTPRSWFACDRH